MVPVVLNETTSIILTIKQLNAIKFLLPIIAQHKYINSMANSEYEVIRLFDWIERFSFHWRYPYQINGFELRILDTIKWNKRKLALSQAKTECIPYMNYAWSFISIYFSSIPIAELITFLVIINVYTNLDQNQFTAHGSIICKQ